MRELCLLPLSSNPLRSQSFWNLFSVSTTDRRTAIQIAPLLGSLIRALGSKFSMWVHWTRYKRGGTAALHSDCY